MLYIVSTPIGNLKDITYRAVEVLKSVDLIACEDTRKTGILTKEYNISTPLISYHDHNKESRGKHIINLLESGENIALVSDAGTPAINDPGFNLVRDARNLNIKVTGVPGACAAINGIAISGLATDRFCYEGFLPVKKGRMTSLEKIKNEERTIIIYEGVHKIEKTLKDLKEYIGDRKIVILREMTKVYEEYIRGTAQEILNHFKENPLKGEFVLIVEGFDKKKVKKTNKYSKKP
ncbi:MAG: 16S rRNA (cytidine(1402)-2'-O)-methyltransferase [Candidatus Cloacimonadota bacterium]|nr:MAG: 16S rRNA (cytidine(1402)-2'-O)-methyltransferase [Candidatus Cloacimonadota bacterium]PIE80192.1 MAG: 16S rRNA (cytidine(1402)-2'-O)-methyltransferase [Candidatus Delongbacteria bacterium]